MDFRAQAKEFLSGLFRAAVHAVSPESAVKEHLRVEGRTVVIGDETIPLDNGGRIYVVGFGKASAAMAKAVEEILGDLIYAGIVVTKYKHTVPLQKIKVFEAGHPVPDEAGVEAAGRLIELVKEAGEKDIVITLISGGGSALLVQPRPGITLADKQQVTQLLLKRGVPIERMNVVRKHLSAVKGGQLARLASPARVYSLIISDVIGDPLESIASGPTAPDPSTFADAKKILSDSGIWDELPQHFHRWFEEESQKPGAETPKPGDPLFEKVRNLIIANNQKALQAAKKFAEEYGYRSLILSSSVQGEAREIARFYGAIARDMRRNEQPLPPPACIIAGGETTVTVRGDGLGGRNTEMVLACLPDLVGLGETAFFSAGTDGTDGPTDAAGAFGFPDSLERAEALGLAPQDFLRRNDSYHFFSALNDLFKTGATGTNVMDIQVVLVR